MENANKRRTNTSICGSFSVEFRITIPTIVVKLVCRQNGFGKKGSVADTKRERERNEAFFRASTKKVVRK